VPSPKKSKQTGWQRLGSVFDKADAFFRRVVSIMASAALVAGFLVGSGHCSQAKNTAPAPKATPAPAAQQPAATPTAHPSGQRTNAAVRSKSSVNKVSLRMISLPNAVIPLQPGKLKLRVRASENSPQLHDRDLEANTLKKLCGGETVDVTEQYRDLTKKFPDGERLQVSLVWNPSAKGSADSTEILTNTGRWRLRLRSFENLNMAEPDYFLDNRSSGTFDMWAALTLVEEPATGTGAAPASKPTFTVVATDIAKDREKYPQWKSMQGYHDLKKFIGIRLQFDERPLVDVEDFSKLSDGDHYVLFGPGDYGRYKGLAEALQQNGTTDFKVAVSFLIKGADGKIQASETLDVPGGNTYRLNIGVTVRTDTPPFKREWPVRKGDWAGAPYIYLYLSPELSKGTPTSTTGTTPEGPKPPVGVTLKRTGSDDVWAQLALPSPLKLIPPSTTTGTREPMPLPASADAAFKQLANKAEAVISDAGFPKLSSHAQLQSGEKRVFKSGASYHVVYADPEDEGKTIRLTQRSVVTFDARPDFPVAGYSLHTVRLHASPTKIIDLPKIEDNLFSPASDTLPPGDMKAELTFLTSQESDPSQKPFVVFAAVSGDELTKPTIKVANLLKRNKVAVTLKLETTWLDLLNQRKTGAAPPLKWNGDSFSQGLKFGMERSLAVAQRGGDSFDGGTVTLEEPPPQITRPLDSGAGEWGVLVIVDNFEDWNTGAQRKAIWDGVEDALAELGKLPNPPRVTLGVVNQRFIALDSKAVKEHALFAPMMSLRTVNLSQFRGQALGHTVDQLRSIFLGQESMSTEAGSVLRENLRKAKKWVGCFVAPAPEKPAEADAQLGALEKENNISLHYLGLGMNPQQVGRYTGLRVPAQLLPDSEEARALQKKLKEVIQASIPSNNPAGPK
jgi:hypothetical protein